MVFESQYVLDLGGLQESGTPTPGSITTDDITNSATGETQTTTNNEFAEGIQQTKDNLESLNKTLYDEEVGDIVVIEKDIEDIKEDIDKIESDVISKPGKIIIIDEVVKGETFNNLDANAASGNYSHAEGANTTANGECSHAEGGDTQALGIRSHAEGTGTIAERDYQHVQGRFNISDSTEFIHIIGNGTNISNRHNAFAIKDDGTIVVWIDDERIELTPSKIKELVEMENQFVVISSALNDLNTRLNQLSSVVATNQTLQPIVYSTDASSYSADDIQAMNLDDEDIVSPE